MKRLFTTIAGIILSLSALPVVAQSNDGSAEEAFPLLEGIRPHVEFWTRVWGEWDLNQVAIHDLEFPGLVYEVVELPGPTSGPYTAEQKQLLEQLRQDWEGYLADLTLRVADGAPLDETDQAWVAHIEQSVGLDKLPGSENRVRTQRGLRERFREGLERSHRFEDEIRSILRQYDLPEDLAYLPHVESSYQYRARSTAGAAGIWQFTRGTGKQFMTVNSVIDERLDPIAATHGAAQYLKHALSRLETWPMALTSYNHGVNGMLKAKKQFGTDFERIVAEYKGRLFGFASRNFYAEFLAAREIASNADRYFPEGFAPEPRWNYESIELDHLASPKWVSAHYDLTVVELSVLNTAWLSKAVKHGHKLPAGTRVWLPAGTLERMASSGRPPQPASSTSDMYVVRSGDSLSRIASRHGVTLSRLREINEISSTRHVIHVGDRLLIPGTERRPEVHSVRGGENLSDIAQSYGLSLTELRRFNEMRPRESIIHVGQTLRLTPPEPTRIHRVRSGDSLSTIAQRYGVSLTALRQSNEISPRSSRIKVGQVLRLPSGAGETPAREHVVRSGDNLSRIAGRYGVALGELMAANSLSSKAVLQPGQILRIPD